jgi:hypothetical protein
MADYQSDPSASPPEGVREADHVAKLIVSATFRTLPSASVTFIPPV